MCVVYLQETEQVLKRELGLEGASQMDTSPHLPPVPQRYVSLSLYLSLSPSLSLSLSLSLN